jgi:hypothetical protein
MVGISLLATPPPEGSTLNHPGLHRKDSNSLLTQFYLILLWVSRNFFYN